MEDSRKQVMHSIVLLVVENMICGSPCMAHCGARATPSFTIIRGHVHDRKILIRYYTEPWLGSGAIGRMGDNWKKSKAWLCLKY